MLLKSGFVLALLLTTASVAVACNIPVFRFALERWRSDPCELIVFCEEQLSADEEILLSEIEKESTKVGGFANIDVLRVNISQTMDRELQDLWESTKQKTGLSLPAAVARSRKGKGQIINHWHGTLKELKTTNLVHSPARVELMRRLQDGEAVIWLMIRSPDENRNVTARTLLESQCGALPQSIQLPEGIGLPGSELYSEIPLLLNFSVLEIAHDDLKEQFMVRQISGLKHQEFLNGEPLIAPVFGRGRVLEVIPANQLTSDLIHDLTEFLCGACSCQVKEQNPGFDLLLSADWNLALFGEGSDGPPPEAANGNGERKTPELIPIPPGRPKKIR